MGQLETWQKQLCEGVSGWQQQLASELRSELRTMVQSLAAAIKALDERLWQIDGNDSCDTDPSFSTRYTRTPCRSDSAKIVTEQPTVSRNNGQITAGSVPPVIICDTD